MKTTKTELQKGFREVIRKSKELSDLINNLDEDNSVEMGEEIAPQMLEVVAVRRDSSTGNVELFKTNDGQIFDYPTMILLVGNGSVSGLQLGGAKDGSKTIRGVADGDPSNNLQALPTF